MLRESRCVTNSSETSCRSWSIRTIAGFSILTQRAMSHRSCRCHAQGLTCEAPVAEEITGVQNSHNRLLALFGRYRMFHLAMLKEEHGIGRVTLPVDAVFPWDISARRCSQSKRPVFFSAMAVSHCLPLPTRSVRSNHEFPFLLLTTSHSTPSERFLRTFFSGQVPRSRTGSRLPQCESRTY